MDADALLKDPIALNLTNREVNTCEFCDEEFIWKHRLMDHMKICHGDRDTLVNDRNTLVNKKKEYACSLCGKHYSRKARLTIHIEIIHDGRRWKCDECGKDFKSNDILKIHQRSIHDGTTLVDKEKEYICHLCEKHYSRKARLTKHIEINHDGRRWKCDECGKDFKRSDILKVHQRSIHVGTKCMCELCGNSYATENLVRLHKKTHCRMAPESTRKFDCQDCNYKAKSSNNLRKHFREMHTLKGTKYFCDKCGKQYAHKETLINHIRMFHNAKGKRFQCHYCQYQSLWRQAMQLHLLKIHGDDGRSIQLVKSDDSIENGHDGDEAIGSENLESFTVDDELQSADDITEQTKIDEPRIVENEEQILGSTIKQLTTDNLIAQFKVDLNDSVKDVANNVNVDAELQVADDVVEQTEIDEIDENKEQLESLTKNCDNLIARFSVDLNDSVRQTNDKITKTATFNSTQVNSSGKPEVNLSCTCHICGKQFLRKSSLSQHIRRKHSDNKKCVCDFCGYESLKDDMVRHQWIHKRQEEEQPKEKKVKVYCFFCDLCDFKAIRKQHLKKHRDVVHERIMQKCDMCGKEYTSHEGLRKHKNLIHFDKSFSCDLCDHQAREPGELKCHKWLHHEQNGANISYSCSICEYKSAKQKELAQHSESVHNGMRFQCSECPHQTKTKQNLRSHFLFIHEKLQHTCPHCKKQYANKHSLAKHIKTSCNVILTNKFEEIIKSERNEEIEIKHMSEYDSEDIKPTIT